MALLSGKRVFIVEDDIKNMAVAATILRQSGAGVIQDYWNNNTIEMLTRAHNTSPIDIILLDLMLHHGISGYDIFAQIKAIPELAAIPIVAVSASEPAIEIPKGQQLGFQGFIAKPINMHIFPEQVANCIGGQSIWIAG